MRAIGQLLSIGIMIVLISGGSSLRGAPAYENGAPSPIPDGRPVGTVYWNGDWKVNDTQYRKDQEIVLTGNLIIEDGGNLTLENCTLRMNVTITRNPLWIVIKDNGTLNLWDKDGDPGTDDGTLITDSLSDTDDGGILDYVYYFRTEPGSRLSMNCSGLEHCGEYDSEEDERTYGLYVEGDALFRYAWLNNSYYGITLVNTTGVVVHGCNATNMEVGLRALGSDNITVERCWFSDGTVYNCFIFEDCQDLLFENNNASAYYQPVYMEKVNNSVVVKNTLMVITSSNYNALECVECNGIEVERNQISSRYCGVLMDTCNVVSICNHTLTPTGYYYMDYHCLRSDDSENLTVRNISIAGTQSTSFRGDGIEFTSSKGILIENTVIEWTQENGIKLQYCSDFTVKGCTLKNASTSSSYYGISLHGSVTGIIKNCTIEYSDHTDIQNLNSNGIVFINNTIGGSSNTEYGIHFQGGDQCDITGNRFLDHYHWSCHIQSGNHNNISHNTFEGPKDGEGLRMDDEFNTAWENNISSYDTGLIVGSGCMVFDTPITDCDTGLKVSSGLADNITVSGSGHYGLQANSGEVLIKNSSFSGSGSYDIRIMSFTDLSLIDCDWDPLKVYRYSQSKMHVRWWGEIMVRDKNGVVPGATVTLLNASDVLEGRGLTGDNGRVIVPITEESFETGPSSTVQIKHNPHNISAHLFPDTAYVTPEPSTTVNSKYTITFNTDTNPAPPYNVKAFSEHADVNISWSYGNLPDLSRFQIFRSEDPASFDLGSPIGTASSSSRHYTDVDGAANWRTYYYCVRAVDNKGQAGNTSLVVMCGDWTIESGVVSTISDRTINLNGTLTVEGGGSLKLKSVDLAINHTPIKFCGIRVKGGGNLEIVDSDDDRATTSDASNISAMNASFPIFFIVEENGRLFLNNSICYGVGGLFNMDIKYQGLYLGGGGSIVRGTSLIPTVSVKFLMLVDSAPYVKIIDMEFSWKDTTPLSIQDSPACTVQGCDFDTGKESIGLSIGASVGSNITGNRFTNCTRGVYMQGCDLSQVIDNDLKYNEMIGIYIYNSDGVEVVNNTIEGQKQGPGIKIYRSDLFDLRDNLIVGSYDGVELDFSFYGGGSNNTISDIDHNGLVLYSSSNNLFNGTTIEDAGQIGLYMTGDYYTSTWNNTFIDLSISSCVYGIKTYRVEELNFIDLNLSGNIVGMLQGTSGYVHFRNSRISSNSNYGVYVESTSPRSQTIHTTFENTTVNNPSGLELYLDDSAVVRCINTSIPYDRINFKDDASKISYFWYIDIYVEDMFGDPASFSDLSATVPGGVTVSLGKVNESGRKDWLLVHQKTSLSSGNISSNPWTFTASLGNHSGTNTTSISNPVLVWIRLSNIAPTVLDLKILPLTPDTSQEIQIGFNYSDPEFDPQFTPEIKWFMNGIERPHLEGNTTVGAQNTSKHQNWYAVVRTFDGASYSMPYTSPVITIKNTPPNASGVHFESTSVSSSREIVVNYTYRDLDGDPEGSTLVWWFVDRGSGFVDSHLTGSPLSPEHTKKGERWLARVLPHDGEEYGPGVNSSEVVVIGNTPPEVVGKIEILPENPSGLDDLSLSYEYYDMDGDPEVNGSYTWYVDGMPAGLDSPVVPSTRLSKGEIWMCIFTPYDGTDPGISVNSSSTLIGNTPPTVFDNITYEPLSPTSSDILRANYYYFDHDGDPESTTILRWYVDRNDGAGFVYSGITGDSVPSDKLIKGQRWKCGVTPYDGESFGTQVLAPASVTIGNTPPQAFDLYIGDLNGARLEGEEAVAGTSLYAHYSYIDGDGDRENGTEIEWYLNGVFFIRGYEIPSNTVEKGQTWCFHVMPWDGDETGPFNTTALRFVSGDITIGNTPPVVMNVSIGPVEPKTKDELGVDLVHFDVDGDPVTEYDIEWYRNNLHIPGYDDLRSVDPFMTQKLDVWYCRVRVGDGADLSDWLSSPSVLVSNSPPVLNATCDRENLSIMEGDSIIFQANVVDPDEEDFQTSWYVDGMIMGLFDSNPQSRFTLSTDLSSKRERNVTVIVTDGTDYVEKSWSVEVRNVNRPPEIEAFDPQVPDPEVQIGKSITFSVMPSDEDEDEVLVEWFIDGEPVKTGTEYVLEGGIIKKGDHIVKVRISDGMDEVTRTWNVTVKGAEEGEKFLGQSYDWWGLLLAIFGGIVSVILAVFGFVKVRKKKSKLKSYMREIDLIRSSEEPTRKKERRLSELRSLLRTEFQKGQVEENHYIILEREVDKALTDGVITRGEYSDLESRLMKDGSMSNDEKERILELLSTWAEDDLVDEEPEPPEMEELHVEVEDDDIWEEFEE